MKLSNLRKIICNLITEELIVEKNINKEIKDWSKNITSNYNDDTDTNILAALMDAAYELDLDINAIDKEWQHFSAGNRVKVKDIENLLKAGM